MYGLMQNWPLTVDRILDHAKTNHGGVEVITRSLEGPITRTNYADLHNRAKQVSAALLAEGLKLGDFVGTIAWNTSRHIETWYGAMGLGIVVHTANPRLHPDQIAKLISHAEDKLLFVDPSFVTLIESIAPVLATVERYVILTDAAQMPKTSLPGAIAYENWIESKSIDAAWGQFPEETACALCYTSGTTGNPKGVLYSHRSMVLHTLITLQRDAVGASAQDVILPIVPMFHANAWGIIFNAPAAGATLVLPGAKLDGDSICELIRDYEVTLCAGVPTVCQSMLEYLDRTGKTVPTLNRILVGGSAIAESVLAAFADRYGVEIIHSWGMTELSPLGTLGILDRNGARLPAPEQRKLKLLQGRVPFMVEMKIVDDDGAERPRDGKSTGRLMVRGPAIAGGYLKGDGANAFQSDGFFDTGDIGAITPQGYLHVTDRAKDVIKSGGEWISSVEIETITLGAPGVANAAVIGVPHPKWGERPLLIIEPKDGQAPDKKAIFAYLEGKIAKWWMPDGVEIIDKIPLGATGKINKLALRDLYGRQHH